jgi:DNA adenine methylase
LPGRDQIVAAAALLNRASIKRQGYDVTLADADRGDSIFLDPPYPPSSKTAYFAHYTTSRFSEFDQHRLASEVKSLDNAGVHFMMTNADCALIRKLYSKYTMESVEVTRWVSCKKVKPVASELIIHNY